MKKARINPRFFCHYKYQVNPFIPLIKVKDYWVTSPAINSCIDPPSTLAVTVTDLLKVPIEAALKVAFTNPVAPGGIGIFDQSGVVQPQEACTLVITMGTFPLFVKMNSWVTGVPCLIFPKL